MSSTDELSYSDGLRLAVDALRFSYRNETQELRSLIAKLSANPLFLRASTNLFFEFNRSVDFGRMRALLAVMGEARNDAAIPFYLSIIESTNSTVLPISQDFESSRQTVRMKAIQAVGYIRSVSSFEALKKIAVSTPIRSSRIEAIETYVWNKDDSETARRELIAVLPSELHPYTDRPRFTSSSNSGVFDERVKKWRKRWERN
jgi:hypothetical protein